MKNTIQMHYRSLPIALFATGLTTPTPQPRAWVLQLQFL